MHIQQADSTSEFLKRENQDCILLNKFLRCLLEKTLMLGKSAGGEGDDRGWDGWMASPTRWTWVWANSRRRWRTGKPGVLPSMGLQRIGHNWATEQQQREKTNLQVHDTWGMSWFFLHRKWPEEMRSVVKYKTLEPSLAAAYPLSFFRKVLLFIYFWLCWVFAAPAFSLVVASGAALQLRCPGSHCGGFSCCGAQALGCVGFRGWGSQVLEHNLNSCGMWA